MYMNRSISRVLAAAVASAGFVAPMPTIAASLSCTGSTFSATPDGKGNINVSCTAPSSTPVCSLTASPTLVAATGGSVTLTASNCGTIAGWTKAGTSVAHGTSWSDTFPANTGTSSVSFTYTVNGDAGSDSVTVTQSAPSGGGGGTSPPPGGSISCPGYTNTIVLDLPWGAPGSAAPRVVSSGFGNDAVVVARFTTPAGTSSNIAQIKSAEWGDQQTFRTAALSTTPCDFPSASANPLARSASIMTGTSSLSVNYTVGGSSGYANLKPSTTYYFNIRNFAFGATTCTSSHCNVFVELQKPSGL